MTEISDFGLVLLFIVGSVVFLLMTILIGKILRPSRPGYEKNATYESGEVAQGISWKKFDVRFYVIALVFLLFEAELVFLFPWALVFGDEGLIAASGGTWSRITMIESFIFIGILGVGLAYVWAKGILNWVRPTPKISEFKSVVPENLYERINSKY